MDTVTLFGIPFSNVTFDEVCAAVQRRIRERDPGYIVTPNVDHVCGYQRNMEFRDAYKDAFLVVADGMPILWAAKLLGTPLTAKLSGSDLVPQLSEFAAREGFSIFCFGAAAGVGEHAAKTLADRFPGLRIAGTYSPPMGFEGAMDSTLEALRHLREADADICFVALGSPRQEIWMYRNCQEVGIPVMIGIGAGLDFAAGRIKRAPVWMQRFGLEWLWRLLLEPRRLWRRYLVEDLLFFVLFWRELRRRLGRHRPPEGDPPPGR